MHKELNDGTLALPGERSDGVGRCGSGLVDGAGSGRSASMGEMIAAEKRRGGMTGSFLKPCPHCGGKFGAVFVNLVEGGRG